jgi:hypothetical protein
MRNTDCAIALAMASLAGLASIGRAADFVDAQADNYGPAYVDIASVQVTNDAANITFTINLNPTANLLATDGSQIYGKYFIGFQTGSSGSTAIQNPYGNPIGISSGTGMDYWIGSWADNSAVEPFSGDAQLYRWNGGAFDLAAGIGTSEPYVAVPVSLSATSTTIVVPIASLGLAPNASFGFDVWTSFGNPSGQSAYDALGKQTQTTAPGAPWEGAPYDSGTAGAGGSSTLLTYTLASATNSSWNVDTNGTWTAASNWTAGVPNGLDHSATFGNAITAARTITLDASQTVGTLNFNSAAAYTITSATNTLTLDVSTGSASLAVASGNHAIAAGVVLADDLVASIGAGRHARSEDDVHVRLGCVALELPRACIRRWGRADEAEYRSANHIFGFAAARSRRRVVQPNLDRAAHHRDHVNVRRGRRSRARRGFDLAHGQSQIGLLRRRDGGVGLNDPRQLPCQRDQRRTRHILGDDRALGACARIGRRRVRVGIRGVGSAVGCGLRGGKPVGGGRRTDQRVEVRRPVDEVRSPRGDEIRRHNCSLLSALSRADENRTSNHERPESRRDARSRRLRRNSRHG